MFTRPGIQMIPEKINVFVVSTSRHFGNTLKNMNTKFKTNNPEYPHVNPFGNMLFSSRNYVNHLSLIEGLLTVFSLCQTFQTPYMNTFWTCFFEFLVTRKQFPHDVIAPIILLVVCEVPIWNPLKIGYTIHPPNKSYCRR
jgi:hypothetical protein